MATAYVFFLTVLSVRSIMNVKLWPAQLLKTPPTKPRPCTLDGPSYSGKHKIQVEFDKDFMQLGFILACASWVRVGRT